MAADRQEWLARRFESHRGHLRAVAYRMLGSLSEADDAVQEAWLRLARADGHRESGASTSADAGASGADFDAPATVGTTPDATRAHAGAGASNGPTGPADAIDNLGGWLTTVVARVCLDMLRSRRSRSEQPLDETHVPEPIVTAADGGDPEHEALLADSVGLALLVVLETLPLPERLAFVLHDMFGVPFDEIAPIVDRSPDAARQLASRARRRVQGADPISDGDLRSQRAIVDAFVAAAREGDFDGLLALLDPDVVLRADFGPGNAASRLVRGATAVAGNAVTFSQYSRYARPVLVNGAAGFVVVPEDGEVFSVVGFTVRGSRIVELDILADPDRLRELDLAAAGVECQVSAAAGPPSAAAGARAAGGGVGRLTLRGRRAGAM